MKKIIYTLVALVVLFVGGIYFVFNTGKTVGTVWDEGDLISGIEKAQIEIDSIEEINLETLAKGNFTTQGVNNIDIDFTSEEMSALISSANDNGGPIKDVRVAFGDDGNGEVSFKLSDTFVDFLYEENILTFELGAKKAYALTSDSYSSNPLDRSLTERVVSYINNVANNRPVYATGELTRTSSNSIEIDIERLTVGRVSMSDEVIERVEVETVRIVNGIISPENGFHIEELQVDGGQLHYKGTLPAEIEGQKIN